MLLIQSTPITLAVAATSPSRRRMLWTTLLLAVAALALALGQIARLPAERGWTTDDGNEYLLTRSIAGGAAGAWSHPALPYPGQPLDPELRWVPIRPPFAQVHDDRLVSVFPPIFPALTAVAYRVIGPYGVYLLPVLGGFLTVLATAILAREFGASPVLAAALVGPLSFQFFYWTVIWGHTLATATTAWALVLLARGRRRPSAWGVPLAGVLLAVGTWVRDEHLVVFVAVVGACAADRVLRRVVPTLGLAYLAGWAPLALWRTVVTGSPVGLHDATMVRLSWPSVLGLPALGQDVLWLLYTLFLSANFQVGFSLALGAGSVGAAIALGLAPRWLRRWPAVGPLVLGAVAISALGSMGLLMTRLAPAMSLIRVSGLFTFAPWVVLVGAACLGAEPIADGPPEGLWERVRPVRWLAAFVLLTVLGLCGVLTAWGAQGVHWGPRHLSPVMPALAVLASRGAGHLLRHTRLHVGPQWTASTRVGMAVLFGVALLIQLQGFRQQGRVATGLGTFATAAREQSATALVTHLWWYAQLTGPAYLERPMYWIQSRQDLERWLVRYAEQGGQRFEWATQEPLDRLVEGLPIRQGAVRRVRAKGLAPLDHWLVTFELRSTGPGGDGSDDLWRRLEAKVRASGESSAAPHDGRSGASSPSPDAPG